MEFSVKHEKNKILQRLGKIALDLEKQGKREEGETVGVAVVLLNFYFPDVLTPEIMGTLVTRSFAELPALIEEIEKGE